jgi:broad specificity phosphatase PhoE
MTTTRRSAVRRLVPAALALLLLAGCGTAEQQEQAAPTTLILVRHAEKGPEEPDPDLTEAGRERAALLSSMLREVELSAVYSTKYKRNRQTAAPTARRHGLAVTEYSADQKASDFLSELLVKHPGGAVLVVGHSNTVPGMISALTGEPEPGHLDSYEDLFVVTFAELGRATVVPLKYPCQPEPQ